MNRIQEVLVNEKLNTLGIIVADKIPVIKTYTPSEEHGRYKSGLIFMLKGRCEYRFDDDSFEVGTDDLIYVPEGARYKCTHITEPKSTRYYVLDFNLVDYNGKLLNFSSHPIKFELKNSEQIKTLFEKINQAYNVYESTNHLLLRSITMELLYLLSKSENMSGIADSKYNDIKKALRYVETHYTENISSDTLAKMFNMSQSHFRRLFVKAVGYPPTVYRNRIRVHKAYELLVNSDMPISYISEAVGFCDVYYFSTMFKRIIGISPGKVRK